MAIGISIVLGLAALVYILFPLVHRTSGKSLATPDALPDNDAANTASSLPTEQEQIARTALQEVEFDYQLGNIAEPDYRALRDRYIHNAVVAMKSRHERDEELDEEIEERLRKMKEGHEETEQQKNQ